MIGALFTNFFAHCFINYAAMGPDDPKAPWHNRRARIDWWENSRRAVDLHRKKAMDQAATVPNLSENAWDSRRACDNQGVHRARRLSQGRPFLR